MIPELGHYCLILALLMAGLQTIIPFAAFKIRAAYASFILIAAAFIALTYAFIVSDFSVLLVAENSHTLKPLLYKIAGVWGNHEGSMVLWVLMLAFFSALLARAHIPNSLKSKTLMIQGMLSFGFILFILFTSNPFLRVSMPLIEGAGLNPVLQNPILAIHPPMLYLGYVGFSVVFSLSIAALREGNLSRAWASTVRPFVLIAWTSLSAGIALGSWWAYTELGWGGWWFWDPVENSSLMPWLMGTALLHSIIVLEKRDTLKKWCALLAILTFSLSMLGTFLVRSGVLTSVHSFATDPRRGLFILILLTLYTGGALLLYALKAHKLENTCSFSPLSRESTLILNNLFMVTACATILIGTLYPLLMDALNLGAISVGPPYFSATFVPLALPALCIMAIAPYLSWKKSGARESFDTFKWPMCVGLGGLVLIYIYSAEFPALAYIVFALALWLLAATIYEFYKHVGFSFQGLKNLPRAHWGMSLAHAGMAIAVLGMAGSTLLMDEKVILMKQGDRMSIGRHEMQLQELGGIEGPNFISSAAVFKTTAGDILIPERRSFPAEGQTTTEAAIKTTLVDDLYIALGEPDTQQPDHWVVRAYVHPLISFLWVGFILIVTGGAVSLSARRKAQP